MLVMVCMCVTYPHKPYFVLSQRTLHGLCAHTCTLQISPGPCLGLDDRSSLPQPVTPFAFLVFFVGAVPSGIHSHAY